MKVILDVHDRQVTLTFAKDENFKKWGDGHQATRLGFDWDDLPSLSAGLKRAVVKLEQMLEK